MTGFAEDLAKNYLQGYREGLMPEEMAMFDLAVAMELKRRGLATPDFGLELRNRAELHRTRAPYTWRIMNSLANAIMANIPSQPASKGL